MRDSQFLCFKAHSQIDHNHNHNGYGHSKITDDWANLETAAQRNHILGRQIINKTMLLLPLQPALRIK